MMSSSSESSLNPASGKRLPKTTSITPRSLLRKHPPPIAAYLRTPNCPPGLDLSRPLLLYSTYVSSKVRASSLNICRDGSLSRVGPCLVIPESYAGWFAVITSNGRTAAYYTSMEQVVSANIYFFLTRHDVPGYVIIENDVGITSYRRILVRGGSVMKLVGVFEDFASRYGDSHVAKLFGCKKYAQCMDCNGQVIYLPLNVRGRFYSTAQKSTRNPKNVYLMSHILKNFRLPLSVKLVCGYMPRAPCSFTGLLRLEKCNKEEVILACTMTTKAEATLFEIEVSSHFVFTPITDSLFPKTPIYLKTLSYCQDEAESWQRQIKVTHLVTERRSQSLTRSMSDKVMQEPPTPLHCSRGFNLGLPVDRDRKISWKEKMFRERIEDSLSTRTYSKKAKKTEKKRITKQNPYVFRKERSLSRDISLPVPAPKEVLTTRLCRSFDNLNYSRVVDDINPIPEGWENDTEEEEEDHYATIGEPTSQHEERHAEQPTKYENHCTTNNLGSQCRPNILIFQESETEIMNNMDKSDHSYKDREKKESIDSGLGGDNDESYYSMDYKAALADENINSMEQVLLNSKTSHESETKRYARRSKNETIDLYKIYKKSSTYSDIGYCSDTYRSTKVLPYTDMKCWDTATVSSDTKLWPQDDTKSEAKNRYIDIYEEVKTAIGEKCHEESNTQNDKRFGSDNGRENDTCVCVSSITHDKLTSHVSPKPLLFDQSISEAWNDGNDSPSKDKLLSHQGEDNSIISIKTSVECTVKKSAQCEMSTDYKSKTSDYVDSLFSTSRQEENKTKLTDDTSFNCAAFAETTSETDSGLSLFQYRNNVRNSPDTKQSISSFDAKSKRSYKLNGQVLRDSRCHHSLTDVRGSRELNARAMFFSSLQHCSLESSTTTNKAGENRREDNKTEAKVKAEEDVTTQNGGSVRLLGGLLRDETQCSERSKLCSTEQCVKLEYENKQNLNNYNRNNNYSALNYLKISDNNYDNYESVRRNNVNDRKAEDDDYGRKKVPLGDQEVLSVGGDRIEVKGNTVVIRVKNSEQRRPRISEKTFEQQSYNDDDKVPVIQSGYLNRAEPFASDQRQKLYTSNQSSTSSNEHFDQYCSIAISDQSLETTSPEICNVISESNVSMVSINISVSASEVSINDPVVLPTGAQMTFPTSNSETPGSLSALRQESEIFLNSNDTVSKQEGPAFIINKCTKSDSNDCGKGVISRNEARSNTVSNDDNYTENTVNSDRNLSGDSCNCLDGLSRDRTWDETTTIASNSCSENIVMHNCDGRKLKSGKLSSAPCIGKDISRIEDSTFIIRNNGNVKFCTNHDDKPTFR